MTSKASDNTSSTSVQIPNTAATATTAASRPPRGKSNSRKVGDCFLVSAVLSFFSISELSEVDMQKRI